MSYGGVNFLRLSKKRCARAGTVHVVGAAFYLDTALPAAVTRLFKLRTPHAGGVTGQPMNVYSRAKRRAVVDGWSVGRRLGVLGRRRLEWFTWRGWRGSPCDSGLRVEKSTTLRSRYSSPFSASPQ
jgi:hypothetical protein